MAGSKETYGKKEVKKKQAKKRKDKENRRLEKKEKGQKSSFDDMIAYVDANGQLVSTPPDLSQKEEIDVESIEVGIPKSDNTGNSREKAGKVISYNESKGFGFISCPTMPESIFFHDNDTLEHLSLGDQVIFETEKGLKGLKAVDVKKLK